MWKGWENVEIKMGVGEGESERQGLVIAENSNKFLSPFRTLFAERSSTWMKDGGLALAINLGISLPVLSSRSKNTKTNTTDGFQSLKSTSSIIIVLHFSCILVKQKKQRWGVGESETRDPLVSKAETTLSFPRRFALSLLKEQKRLYLLGGWRISFYFTIPPMSSRVRKSKPSIATSNAGR